MTNMNQKVFEMAGNGNGLNYPQFKQLLSIYKITCNLETY